MSDPIETLRALLSKATPGPWRAHNFRSYEREAWSVVADGDEPPVCDDACSEHDARAIAALRTLAPELLAVVEAARPWDTPVRCAPGCDCAPCRLGDALAALDGAS